MQSGEAHQVRKDRILGGKQQGVHSHRGQEVWGNSSAGGTLAPSAENQGR